MTEGLLGVLREKPVPQEQIRLATILNGGVSLAVWMGGVTVEIDRLVKAEPLAKNMTRVKAGGVYAALLAFVGSTVRVDVISGTSAGGINGAALALAQATTRSTRLSMLRELWSEQGDIRSLLRQPFSGAPTSLLKGDDYFLPRLQDMMRLLADQPSDPEPPPLDLSITATVLRGNQTVRVDSMGTLLPQELHAGRFHWRSDGSTSSDNPFHRGQLRDTAAELALACRTTASFPFAFEPVFVPVGSSNPPEDRPDMARTVRGWGDAEPGKERSRYAVDGGLLANTPTRAALEAIDKMQADAGPIRRVILLIYPHAPEPAENRPDKFDDPPSVVETVLGLVAASTSEGSRTFVDELDDHNQRAAGRHGTRDEVVSGVGSSQRTLTSLVGAIYPHYRKLVVWRAGRDLAGRATDLAASANAGMLRDQGWNYERVRRAAEAAQEGWRATHGKQLPYVRWKAPRRKELEDPKWRWGDTAALGIVDTVSDLLSRVLRQLPNAGSGLYKTVSESRTFVSKSRQQLIRLRQEVDSPWEASEWDEDAQRVKARQVIQSLLMPNQKYWTLRLASYARLMAGGTDKAFDEALSAVVDGFDPGSVSEIRAALALLLPTIPDTASTATGQMTANPPNPTVPPAGVTGAAGVRSAAPTARAIGVEVHALVEDCAGKLKGVFEALHSLPAASHELAAIQVDSGLADWRNLLANLDGTYESNAMLHVLLQVEMATTALGDELRSGVPHPMELVQLSAATPNRFAVFTRTADDKLGGWSVRRFGGFLKRSWRVNDWIWGRLDATTMLCRTILAPERVRRAARLAGYLPRIGAPAPLTSEREKALRAKVEELAFATVDELRILLFSNAETPDQPVPENLLRDAENELRVVFNPLSDLPAALPALADLFALALQSELVSAELPALAAAIRVDRKQGAYHQSRGELFLEEHHDLLTHLDQAARTNQELPVGEQLKALEVFDRAGIGREPLADEARSDAMIQTVTTAGAVGITLLDSSKSGLTAIKPATRALRGAALVPYWTLSGLASSAGLFRNMAFLSLALGGALLVLAIFGALPEALLVPAATLGGGAVVVALAYGALRTGTMLHGLVLLPSAIVLTAIGIKQGVEAKGGHPDAALNGAFAAGALVALFVALLILGSLPGTNRSVIGAVIALMQDRRRRIRAALRLAVLAITALSFWRLWIFLAGDLWLTALNWAKDHLVLMLLCTVTLSLIGGVLAIGLSWLLKLIGRRRIGPIEKRWRTFSTKHRRPHLLWSLLKKLPNRNGAQRNWRLLPLADTAGVAAGWAVVYGTAYLVGCLVFAWKWSALLIGEEVWIRMVVGGLVVTGVLLIIAVPIALPLLQLRKVGLQEVARAGLLDRRQVLGRYEQDRRIFVDDLAVRSCARRGHVKISRTTPDLVLTRRGEQLFQRVRRVRETPVSLSGS